MSKEHCSGDMVRESLSQSKQQSEESLKALDMIYNPTKIDACYPRIRGWLFPRTSLTSLVQVS